jgi:hypothetical protein
MRTATTAPPIAEFVYVDTAIGGASHRNRVMRREDLAPPPGASGVYTTYFHYTRELADYATTNPNVEPDKRPSVKWFRGTAFATFVPVDFDQEGDPDRARDDAIRAVNTLEARYDVVPAAVRVAFSGNKGFSLEIPGTLFGGFAPAANLPARFKRLAGELFGDYATFDPKIYESVRLWRVVNYRHEKSGLYKIRLSFHELKTLTIDEIRQLATGPRDFQDVPDDEWFPRAGLVDAWASTAIPENGDKPNDGAYETDTEPRPLTDEQERTVEGRISPYWFQSQKHAVAFGLAGWFAIAGVPFEQAERMFKRLSASDTRPDDRLNCLRDAYTRRTQGLPIAGPSRLQDHLSREDMDALERIMPTRANLIRGSSAKAASRLQLGDFVADLEAHKYLYRATGKLWPRASVNAAVPPVLDGIDEDGNPVFIPASNWLDEHEPVHQLTWSPGDPEIIEGRLLNQGGWVQGERFRSYNLYRPPTIALGDPGRVGPWVDHVRRLYPAQADHIIDWLAHRVQRPAEKVNHALLLGSEQGCGKDTILKPVREAIGPWNYADASPAQVVGRFNGFLKSVMLLVPELCDLGDINRYSFYEHMKPIIAAPPTTLRCDEKFMTEIAVINVTGVVFTSNQRIGIYLPAGDRRHFAAWSEIDPADLPAGYFATLHRWLDDEGGSAHVAAYLHAVDLSGFDPNAPPPKTEWFWSIVDAGRAPEESELSTLLDWMAGDPGKAEEYPNGGAWPDAVTLARLIAAERQRTGYDAEHGRGSDFASWLEDRKNRRQIPHRMEAVGYVPVRNDGAKDGFWKVAGARMVVYAKQELSRKDQLIAVNRVISETR